MNQAVQHQDAEDGSDREFICVGCSPLLIAALACQKALPVARILLGLASSRYDVMGCACMVSVLVGKMAAIRQACKHFGIVRLDIFGSALREDFEPDRSDIDFAVDFGPMPRFNKPDTYFGLLNELRTIVETEVDLVIVGTLKNRYIREDVNRSEQPLYAT